MALEVQPESSNLLAAGVFKDNEGLCLALERLQANLQGQHSQLLGQYLGQCWVSI